MATSTNPPADETLKISQSKNGSHNRKTSKNPDYKWAFLFGCISLAMLLTTLLAVRNLTPDQRQSFKVVLALGASGVAAAIPGVTTLKHKGWWSAGGAIVIFFVVLALPAPNPEFHLTIYPQNEAEDPIILPDQSLSLNLASGYKLGESTSLGTIRFNDVPGIYAENDSVQLTLRGETNWTFANRKKTIRKKLNMQFMNITFLPDPAHYVVSGTLEYDGQFLQYAEVSDMEDSTRTTKTDKSGHFKLFFEPGDKRARVAVAVTLPRKKQVTLDIEMGNTRYAKNIEAKK